MDPFDPVAYSRAEQPTKVYNSYEAQTPVRGASNSYVENQPSRFRVPNLQGLGPGEAQTPVPQVLFVARPAVPAKVPSEPSEPDQDVDLEAIKEDTARRLEQQAKVIALQGEKIHQLEKHVAEGSVKVLAAEASEEELAKLQARVDEMELRTNFQEEEIQALREAQKRAEKELHEAAEHANPANVAMKELWKDSTSVAASNTRLQMKIHYCDYELKALSQHCGELEYHAETMRMRHAETSRLQEIEERTLTQVVEQRDLEILRTRQQISNLREELRKTIPLMQTGPELEGKAAHEFKRNGLHGQERIDGAIKHLKDLQDRLFRAEQETEEKNKSLQNVMKEIISLRTEMEVMQTAIMK